MADPATAALVFQGISAGTTLLGAVATARQKAPSPAPLPAPQEPAAMPDPNDIQSKRAAEQEFAKRRQLSGRASTFLSQSGEGDTLG